MKKIYMKPVLVVQQIAVHKMICVSDPQLLLSTEKTVDAEDVESRRHDVWDDDEDEDY
jgi:hypothetical protein